MNSHHVLFFSRENHVIRGAISSWHSKTQIVLYMLAFNPVFTNQNDGTLWTGMVLAWGSAWGAIQEPVTRVPRTYPGLLNPNITPLFLLRSPTKSVITGFPNDSTETLHIRVGQRSEHWISRKVEKHRRHTSLKPKDQAKWVRMCLTTCVWGHLLKGFLRAHMGRMLWCLCCMKTGHAEEKTRAAWFCDLVILANPAPSLSYTTPTCMQREKI